MKASDYFKTMEEVLQFCESFKPQCTEAEYQTLLTIFGLGEQEGTFVELEGIGKIDIVIANYIQSLNQAGLPTLASRSGLQKDHPDSETKPGYISFSRSPKALESVQAVAQKLNLTWQESETYLQPSIFVKIEGGNDEIKEHLWEVFVEAMLEEVGKG